MSDLTVSEFKARFPEFDSASESEIQFLIDDTLCNFDQNRWDCLYKRGHSLYIAHLIFIRTEQLSDNSGSVGLDSVQGQTADGVSINYATYTPSTLNEAFMMGTSYGREYLTLWRTVGIGGYALCSD